MFVYFAFHVSVFLVYPGNSTERFMVYSIYSGNLMFAAVCVFNVSTRMCTIKKKIKWRKACSLETLIQTREPSCSDPRVLIATTFFCIITIPETMNTMKWLITMEASVSSDSCWLPCGTLMDESQERESKVGSKDHHYRIYWLSKRVYVFYERVMTIWASALLATSLAQSFSCTIPWYWWVQLRRRSLLCSYVFLCFVIFVQFLSINILSGECVHNKGHELVEFHRTSYGNQKL